MESRRFSEVEQTQAAPDYARYDRIWQRVAPGTNPYPQARAANQAAAQTMQMPAQPINGATQQNTAPSSKQLMLPGAEANPCCMGSEAQELSLVLEGFAQEEKVDSMTYVQLARYAPNRSAATILRELGKHAEQRSKELGAAYYLITGEQKRIDSAGVVLPRLPYRELLRQRYHDTACNAFNYARAQESTPDPCLQRLLHTFSAESYHDADQVLKLLAQLQ